MSKGQGSGSGVAAPSASGGKAVGRPSLTQDARDAVSKILPGRKNVTEKTLANLAGLEGRVSITVNRNKAGEVRNIVLEGREGPLEVRRVLQRTTTGLELNNNIVHVDPGSQGKGIYKASLELQIATAKALKISKITAKGEGNYGSVNNGYYTLPRLGFDAKLPSTWIKDHGAKLPSNVGGASKVSDLMKTSEGREYWKRHGIGLYMTLDTRKH